jgi:hypothetical protein
MVEEKACGFELKERKKMGKKYGVWVKLKGDRIRNFTHPLNKKQAIEWKKHYNQYAHTEKVEIRQLTPKQIGDLTKKRR